MDIIVISLLTVLPCLCNAWPADNLALGANAVQSSTYNELADADHAVDGNRESDYMMGSCTHTGIEDNPWWRVDLKSIYCINKVIITNRRDCCEERIIGAQIRIGNSLANNGNNNELILSVLTATTAAVNSIRGMVVCFNGATRDFPITKAQCASPSAFNNLSILLQEVQFVSTAVSSGVNSMFERFHKRPELKWISMKQRNITLRAATVLTAPRHTQRLEFKPIYGRYVNIVLPGTQKILTLCEVEVYADNIAFGAKAVQSSTYNELADADHAVDGNRESNYMMGSCTHTGIENNPWWRVDLKRIYSINKVIITNRRDCCEERIIGAQIRIGNSLNNNGNNNEL
ncbi:uncharacterized protein [Paramisgurnus dabryanus]|uniref:uncharacterized protein n=1 Tax=Paramisgurnus dabryanus TaxID=90735 RepID=UPI003CCF6837